MNLYDVKYELCTYLSIAVEADCSEDAVEEAETILSNMSKQQIIDWIVEQVGEYIDVAQYEPVVVYTGIVQDE